MHTVTNYAQKHILVSWFWEVFINNPTINLFIQKHAHSHTVYRIYSNKRRHQISAAFGTKS